MRPPIFKQSHVPSRLDITKIQIYIRGETSMQGQGSQEHAILLFGGDRVRHCSQPVQKIPLPHVLESLHAPVEYRYILVKVSSNSIETNPQPTMG